jgi:hypothetical protein
MVEIVRAKWVVNVKGGCGRSFEITVLRDDNVHGKRSYGWMDHDKLYISGSGGPCNDVIKLKSTWEGLLKIAQATADELNAKESNAEL